jgi:riboflavin transporter FmnP
MNKTVKWIARTAVMLALALLFQSLRMIIPMPGMMSQYIVGSLVNLALIVAAIIIDAKGGLVVAVLTPVVAFFQGHIPQAMPLMILFVALGNAVIVVAYALLYKESFISRIIALVVGAVAKFVVLYILVVKLALPLIYPGVPDQVRAAMSVNFSWPQLITAAIGGVIALLVIPLLQRALKPINE